MFITKKVKKLNNKAFTLVEIICAVAILAIVSVSVMSFISISSNSFKESNKEVNLQYEAQLAINQIKDMIMDSNRAVCYYEAAETNPGSSDLDHIFLVLNERATGDVAAPYEYPAIKIWYVPSDNKIYYADHTFSYMDLKDKYEDSSHSTVDMKELGAAITTANSGVLADHVSSFLINDATAETTGKVTLKLGLTIGETTYDSSATVVMRNKVIASDNVAEIFDSTRHVRNNGRVNNVAIMLGGVDVTNATLNYENSGVNKPNAPAEGGTSFATYTFAAAVDAIELGTDVAWYLEGSSVEGEGIKSDISNGVVRISSDEKSTSLKVTARSKADITKEASVILSIPDYDRSLGYASNITLERTNFTSSQVEENHVFSVTPSFENPDKVSDKGYVCSLVDNLGNVYSGSGFTQDVGKKEIYLKFTQADSNKTYILTVTTNAKDYEGNRKSDTYTIPVGTLLKPDQIKPKVEINAEKTILDRGGNYEISLTATNMTVTDVTWSIDYKSGFSDSYYYSRKSYVSVSKKSGDNNKGTLKIDKYLDWNKSFSFTVKATAKGRDNKGNYLQNVESGEITFTVNPVVILLSNNESTISGKNASNKTIKYQIQNILLSDSSEIKFDAKFWFDNTYGPFDSKDVTVDTKKGECYLKFNGNKGFNGKKITLKMYISHSEDSFSKYDDYTDYDTFLFWGYYTYEKATYSNELTWTIVNK